VKITIEFDEIFSEFYTLMTDPTFYAKGEEYCTELMISWINKAIGTPYIRKEFSTLEVDEDFYEIDFELKMSIDEYTDKAFVLEVFAEYLNISWMKQQIDSVLNIAFVLGGSEEKKIQSNYKQNMERLKSLETSLKKKIRDYSYHYNEYIET